MWRSAGGLAAVTALALGSQARAATVIFTLTDAFDSGKIYASSGPNSGTIGDSKTVTPFDATLGTLTGVTIEAKGLGVDTIVSAVGPIPPGLPGPPPNSARLNVTNQSGLGAPLSTVLGSSFEGVDSESVFSGEADWSFDTTTHIVNPASLAAFLSTAPVLSLADTFNYSANYDAGSYLPASYTELSGAFTTVVTYDYSPVAAPPTSGAPEPAQWALMLLGFAGVGGLLRRRRTAAAPSAA